MKIHGIIIPMTPIEHPTHVTSLKAGIVIVQGLDLRQIHPGASSIPARAVRGTYASSLC